MHWTNHHRKYSEQPHYMYYILFALSFSHRYEGHERNLVSESPNSHKSHVFFLCNRQCHTKFTKPLVEVSGQSAVWSNVSNVNQVPLSNAVRSWAGCLTSMSRFEICGCGLTLRGGSDDLRKVEKHSVWSQEFRNNGASLAELEAMVLPITAEQLSSLLPSLENMLRYPLFGFRLMKPLHIFD